MKEEIKKVFEIEFEINSENNYTKYDEDFSDFEIYLADDNKDAIKNLEVNSCIFINNGEEEVMIVRQN